MKDGFNQTIVLAEDKKSKKGDGVNAVLVLMKDLRDFQDKLESCVEAQAIEENRAKIEAFQGHLEEMYKVLLDIAAGGIRTIRNPEPEVEETEDVVEEAPVEKVRPSVEAPKAPVM